MGAVKKFGCQNSDGAKKDLIRFINSVSFFCASRQNINLAGKPKGSSILKDPDCWKTKSEALITKEDKADLQSHISTCLSSILKKSAVGPALKKDALNGEISKSKDDFQNPDDEAKFCFTA